MDAAAAAARTGTRDRPPALAARRGRAAVPAPHSPAPGTIDSGALAAGRRRSWRLGGVEPCAPDRVAAPVRAKAAAQRRRVRAAGLIGADGDGVDFLRLRRRLRGGAALARRRRRGVARLVEGGRRRQPAAGRRRDVGRRRRRRALMPGGAVPCPAMIGIVETTRGAAVSAAPYSPAALRARRVFRPRRCSLRRSG